ncbi:UNVERIFIED_CONTAM: D-galacturonate reductase [Sesamum angustifolium]|uniref:D-galacturonate reductase n=1 Tax=Sesamum angustifolium TaxID=2727405 RepID=A0AAW2JIH3_9LAMI
MAGVAMPTLSLSGCEKPVPVIGMGTMSYPPVDIETTKAAILEAMRAGYRHFDTAFAYGSEKPLGEAIAEALRVGLIQSRDELFITTKLWSSFADPAQVVPACRMSLQNLQLEYVDLYLIHQPVRLTEMISRTPVAAEIIRPLDVKGVWEGMEECKNLGLTKGIGVEMNPVWQQKQLREFCKARGVHITAYSPLGANNTKWGDNRIVESDVLADIAKAKGKTTAQVALRWAYEQGVSIVTKSFNKQRMRENLQIFDWALSTDDLEKINQLLQRKGVTLASILGPHDLILELDAEV